MINFKLIQGRIAQNALSENAGFAFTLVNITCQIFLPLILLILLNTFLIYYLRNRRQVGGNSLTTLVKNFILTDVRTYH